jgi:hypothetical protein
MLLASNEVLMKELQVTHSLIIIFHPPHTDRCLSVSVCLCLA